MTRYHCTLDSETFAKAVSELNEPTTNHERLAAIDSLRNSFKNRYPRIQLEHEDDIFILSFLRAKKFQHEKSLVAIKNYHIKDLEHPEVFTKAKTPKILEQIYDTGVICPVKGKANDGSAVIVFRLGICDYPLRDIFCLVFLTFKNMILDEEKNQIHGFTIIHDLTHFNPSFVKKFDADLGKIIAKTFSTYLPVRVKQLNITNQPKSFNLMFGLVTTFMSEKVKSIVKKHGKNFAKLHQSISKTLLPHFVGGIGPDLNPAFWKTKVLK